MVLQEEVIQTQLFLGLKDKEMNLSLKLRTSLCLGGGGLGRTFNDLTKSLCNVITGDCVFMVDNTTEA